MAVHRNLTGADLHEPKGADTALSGQVYVADGAGSGSWVDASTIITNSAFTTGDSKLTLKTSADTGWVIMDDGSIGDGSSSATTRANADCEDLFLLLWTNMSDTWCPVSGGRGASAAADWAAHKRITLPRQLGRALIISGSGASLTARTLGSFAGGETSTLVTANLPAYTPSGTIISTFAGFNIQAQHGSGFSGNATGLSNGNGGAITSTIAPTGSVTSTFTGTAQGGTSTPVSIMQPWAAWNIMIKL